MIEINHILDLDNPHQTTKEQAMLFNVANIRPSTREEVIALTNDNTYIPLDANITIDAFSGYMARFGLHLINNEITAILGSYKFLNDDGVLWYNFRFFKDTDDSDLEWVDMGVMGDLNG